MGIEQILQELIQCGAVTSSRKYLGTLKLHSQYLVGYTQQELQAVGSKSMQRLWFVWLEFSSNKIQSHMMMMSVIYGGTFITAWWCMASMSPRPCHTGFQTPNMLCTKLSAHNYSGTAHKYEVASRFIAHGLAVNHVLRNRNLSIWKQRVLHSLHHFTKVLSAWHLV